jgi:hypothetical protein
MCSDTINGKIGRAHHCLYHWVRNCTNNKPHLHSALFSQCTSEVVVGKVNTGECPLVYLLAHTNGMRINIS